MVQINFNVWGNGSINRSGRIISDAPTYVIIHGYQSTAGNTGNNYQPADWMSVGKRLSFLLPLPFSICNVYSQA
ncbi:hypothetical protein VB735_14040 [Halotia wernerae UHCC 0503]|nr:hypothetical protein [Halotia wernerae UHCC 0503]